MTGLLIFAGGMSVGAALVIGGAILTALGISKRTLGI